MVVHWRYGALFFILFYCCAGVAQEPPTLLTVTADSSPVVIHQDLMQEPNRFFLVRHFARWCESCANGNELDFTHLIDRQTQEETFRNNPADLSCIDGWVQQILKECGAEDLGVVDIDDFCFETNDPTFQTRYIFSRDPAFEPYARLFNAFEAHESSRPDYVSRVSMRIIFQKRRLIEPCIAAIINNLQSRGVPVLALSSFSSGQYGCVRKVEEHRYQELFSAGIALENVAIDVDREALNTQFFSDMRGRYERRGAVALHRNILSAAREQKGFVLNRFIAFMQKKPRRVYFFDDAFENHESVCVSLKQVGIPLTSFLYTGAREMFSGCAIDLTVAKKQFAYMREQDEYISYADARELVQSEQGARSSLAQQAVSFKETEGEVVSDRRLAEVCTALVTQLLERTADESEEADDESETAFETEQSLAQRVVRFTSHADDSCVLPGWHVDCAAVPEADSPGLFEL